MSNFRRFGCTTIVVCVLAVAAGGSAQSGKPPGGGGGSTTPPPSYLIQLLGTLPGGNSSHALGMNNRGDVVGYSQVPIGVNGYVSEKAFLNVSDGAGGRVMIDLSAKLEAEGLFSVDGPLTPLDEETMAGSFAQEACSVNDSGQIVLLVTTRIPGQNSVQEPYRYTPQANNGTGNVIPARLQRLAGHGWRGKINSHGDVVSYAFLGDGDHTLLWTDEDGTIDLGLALGTDARVWDLNDQAQICGGSSLWYRAWRYTPGTGYQNLGVLKGGYSSFALGINNSGQVAVTCRLNSRELRMCRYVDGQGLKSLGTLGGADSEAAGINNGGSVVGESDTANGSRHLCLYSDKTGLFDLTAATVNLPAALSGVLNLPFDGGRSLNDGHQVCGTAGDFAFSGVTLPNGSEYEAFLLTPIQP